MGQTSGQEGRFVKSRYHVNPHQMIGSVDEEMHTNCHICDFAYMVRNGHSVFVAERDDKQS